MAAQIWASASWPTKRAVLGFRPMGRSTVVLSSSIRPTVRNRRRPLQYLAMRVGLAPRGDCLGTGARCLEGPSSKSPMDGTERTCLAARRAVGSRPGMRCDRAHQCAVCILGDWCGAGPGDLHQPAPGTHPRIASLISGSRCNRDSCPPAGRHQNLAGCARPVGHRVPLQSRRLHRAVPRRLMDARPVPGSRKHRFSLSAAPGRAPGRGSRP